MLRIIRETEPCIGDLECSICLNVLDYPNSVQTDAGHTFCTKCIVNWLESHNSCPFTRNYLQIEMLNPLNPTKLKKLARYRSYGCNQMRMYKNIAKHENVCKFLIQKCENCNRTCDYETINNHNCLYNMIIQSDALKKLHPRNFFKNHLKIRDCVCALVVVGVAVAYIFL